MRARIVSPFIYAVSTGAAAACAMISWGSLALGRNAVWADDYTLWRDSSERTSDSLRKYRALGLACVLTGRWEEGVRVLRRAVDAYPLDYVVHYLLGRAYEGQGDLQGAWRAFTASLKVLPGFGTLTADAVARFSGRGAFDGAEPFTRNYVSIGPSEVYSHLGILSERAGRDADAEAFFRKAEAEGPNHAQGALNLGTFLARQGRVAEALSAYRRALIFNPALSPAHEGIASVMRGMGRDPEAGDHERRDAKSGRKGP